MLSSYKYAGEVHPKCFQLQLLIVAGDNFTKSVSSVTVSDTWKGCGTASIQYGTDAETLISE